jgi:mono/diheme cytochrome c family protein
MRRISRQWYLTGLVLAAGLAVGVGIWSSQSSNADDAAPPPSNGQPIDPLVARGDYLVNQVAMCGDCHTPHDNDGNLIKSQWLQGADINFAPDPRPAHWPRHAPGIAGLPSFRGNQWSADDMIKFMNTGLNPRGHYAGPPMPAYRLSVDDAKAVTAYLQTLPAAPAPQD